MSHEDRRSKRSKSREGDLARGDSKDELQNIWKSFGRYVSKQLTAGRGVGIQRLGVFTFTPIYVDLAGTTNPHQRDRQLREPVFIVGKDFVPGYELRSGIVNRQN